MRKIENLAFPLIALTGVAELRAYLEQVEVEAIRAAREMGATAENIADALGITRQGAYYKLKQIERNSKGEPRLADDVAVSLPEVEPASSEEA